jgi:hypothetical protein
MEAPQKHRLLNPHVVVDILTPWRGQYKKDEVTLLLAPGHDREPLVTFSGGPRSWWDTDAGYVDITIPLDRLLTVKPGTLKEMVAAEMAEVYGVRAMSAISTDYRPRLWKIFRGRAQRMLQLQVGQPRRDGVVRWYPPADARRGIFCEAALISQEEFASALYRLEAAAKTVETVKVDYTSFRKLS